MLKKVIIGFVATIAMVTTFAFSESMTKNITVEFIGSPITANGKELKFDKQPLIYDGTLYIPINTVTQSNNQQIQILEKPKAITYKEDDIEVVEEDGKKYVMWRSVVPKLMASKYRAERKVDYLRLYYNENNKMVYVTDQFLANGRLRSIGSQVVIDYDVYKNVIEPLLNEKR